VHSTLWVRERLAYFFDYIFVAQKDYVEHFKSLGHKQVHWLPLACDPQIHGDRQLARVYDIGFVGKVMSSDHERSKILQELARRFKMNEYGRWYEKEEITGIYSASKIVVNIPANGDLNMRVFEAMAAGALLITKKIANGQADLFRHGENLVEYKDTEDLLAKVSYYLQNEKERARIALNGRQLAIKEHTYERRCEQILKTVFAGAPVVLVAKVREDNPTNVHLKYAEVFSMMRKYSPSSTK